MILFSADGAHVLSPYNAYGRCTRCLTYWEVTPQGKIVNIKWGIDVPPDRLPKALLERPADWAPGDAGDRTFEAGGD